MQETERPNGKWMLERTAASLRWTHDRVQTFNVPIPKVELLLQPQQGARERGSARGFGGNGLRRDSHRDRSACLAAGALDRAKARVARERVVEENTALPFQGSSSERALDRSLDLLG